VYQKTDPQRLFQWEDIPKIFAYEIFKNFIEKKILNTVSDLSIFQSMLTVMQTANHSILVLPIKKLKTFYHCDR
jgi:hypothetical protein